MVFYLKGILFDKSIDAGYIYDDFFPWNYMMHNLLLIFTAFVIFISIGILKNIILSETPFQNSFTNS